MIHEYNGRQCFVKQIKVGKSGLEIEILLDLLTNSEGEIIDNELRDT